MKAWHFLKDSGELRWPCNGVTKPEVGQKLTVSQPLVMCEVGLHASERVIDALEYAPGALVCRVELGGEIIRDSDKLVASERTIIAMADATRALHEFACWNARNALSLVDDPEPRSLAAVEAKEKWLRGEIGNEELAAARDAARGAARAAARAAAWDAAWAAARAAAKDAAWDAARGAANEWLTQQCLLLLGIEA